MKELVGKLPCLTEEVYENQVKTLIEQLAGVLENDISGDVVEMGCNEGATSIFIQYYLKGFGIYKRFHVYDSFEGFPELSVEDQQKYERKFVKGDFVTSPEQMRYNFRKLGISYPIIHKGWFGELKDKDLPERICFAFLDGDLYQSIMDSLNKIYDRLSHGAVVCIHDYQWKILPGVEKAVNDFLSDKPERDFVSMVNNIGIFHKI